MSYVETLCDSSTIVASDVVGLRGKSAAMLTFSTYPDDPRPRRTAETLLRAGMTLDVICIGGKDAAVREKRSGLSIYRLPITHRRENKLAYICNYTAFIALSTVIAALRMLWRRYDLVYVNNMPDILVVSALVPKMFGARVILDLHDPMPELMMTIFARDKASLGVRLLRWLERWSIDRADHVVTVNAAMKRLVSSRSCHAEKIDIVMNSPDDRVFPLCKAPSSHLRVKHSGSRFVLMYHGTLVERNGLGIAVDAVEQLRKDIPLIELKVYGRSTPYLDQVLRGVRARGLEDSIRYLGPRTLEELVTEIENCDAGIVPNTRSPFSEINLPTRIFEYLAVGKPVIAPLTPGIKDYFSPDALLFFDPGDAGSLAEQIERLFLHYNECLLNVVGAQQVYRAHAWPQERERLVNVVNALLQTV